MNSSELLEILISENYDPEQYSINVIDEREYECAWCLRHRGDLWFVFWIERGTETRKMGFRTENEACEHLLWIYHDHTRKEKLVVKHLDIDNIKIHKTRDIINCEYAEDNILLKYNDISKYKTRLITYYCSSIFWNQTHPDIIFIVKGKMEISNILGGGKCIILNCGECIYTNKSDYSIYVKQENYPIEDKCTVIEVWNIDS